MAEETCPRAYENAIQAAGGREGLTEEGLHLLDIGVRAGLVACHDLLTRRLEG